LILVDSNVWLDILTQDPTWYKWSSAALANAAQSDIPCINPMIYAEVSIGFSRVEEVEAAFPQAAIRRLQIPWEAAFLAGKCFVKYRRGGGVRRSPLPDFFIGAHAAVAGLTLLTRDATRYRTCFPKLSIIAPGP
jgi:predicted nucleic acid-binding protein